MQRTEHPELTGVKEKIGMVDTASTAESAGHGSSDESHDDTKRDFLLYSTIAVGAAGTVMAAWPFIDTMNPSKDVLALASTELDISSVEVGQSITTIWRGKPVFVRRRTAKEIEAAQATELKGLIDPEADKDRVKKSEWLVMIGICTHLGCIPMGQKSGDTKGEFGGWFCPCHGSHYDTSGRIRKGPAPENLAIPPYKFVDDTNILIG